MPQFKSENSLLGFKYGAKNINKRSVYECPEMVMEILLKAVYDSLVGLGEDVRLIHWSNNVVAHQMREQGLYSDVDKYSDGEDL